MERPMNAYEVIARYDEERNNNETFDNKLTWIKELEHTVLSDVILTHRNDIESPETYFDEWSADTPLLIPVPYTDCYVHYIDMKLNMKLNQLKKYNNASSMFNNTYITFQQWYNRHNKPLSVSRWARHEVL